MSHFVLIYSRLHRGEPEVERIDDPGDALKRLLALERDLAGDSERGVVMLVAEDESDLRRTHAHYFAASAEELLGTIVA